VVNVANSPTFDEASPGFFCTSMNNLLAAGESAGVRHQVILSIVGVDQVPQLVHYRAKTLQEDLLRQGPTPYSIVRAAGHDPVGNDDHPVPRSRGLLSSRAARRAPIRMRR
jgi:uncharacterized protein YbjT (DUF2867 family)